LSVRRPAWLISTRLSVPAMSAASAYSRAKA
jgi:hypothetical protein